MANQNIYKHCRWALPRILSVGELQVFGRQCPPYDYGMVQIKVTLQFSLACVTQNRLFLNHA
ncbi:MAG: hypothetical protein AB4426_31405 [Xenococcaceae cyanobacterium]